MAPKSQIDEMPALNLTPMIDVLFLLIIFFMVGTEFIESERQIGLKVPSVTDSGALTPAPEKKMINVYSDGVITLDQSPVTLEELSQRLTSAPRQYRGMGVLVRGDAASAFQHVASVLNVCRQAGISDLGISVRLATTETDHARR